MDRALILRSHASPSMGPSDDDSGQKADRASGSKNEADGEVGRPVVDDDGVATRGEPRLKHHPRKSLEVQWSSIDRGMPSRYVGDA